MKKFFHNIIWRNETERVNIMFHLFIYMTFMFGVAFALLPELLDADESFLFQQTVVNFGGPGASLWGLACLLAAAMVWGGSGFRSMHAMSSGAFLGVLCWLYSLIIYVIGEYPFGILVAALPQLVFWIYLYFRITFAAKFHTTPSNP